MPSYRNSDPHPPIMQGSPPPQQWRVPRVDWDRPPWNRWSFQHVREILPTVTVSRGDGPVFDLPSAPADLGGLVYASIEGERRTVDEMLDDTYADGFLVAIGGKVVMERYFNAMTPATIHLAQSVSKSVTSTVAGIMVGRSLLDPAAPVTEYLPELRQTAWNGATLRHVLDMTSGVRFGEEYTDPLSDIGKTDVASGWKPVPPGYEKEQFPASIWEQILSLQEREAEHGTRFSYRSIETDVLAFAMERASGKRLAQLVGDELWSRIGAENDACFTVDAAGYALADGGFNASLRDFARFGLLHLNGGRNHLGEQVVPAEWIADIRRGAHGMFNDDSRDFLPRGRYRNMFWIEHEDRETVMCVGVFGQLVYIAPERDLVAVKLSTWPDFLNTSFKLDTLSAIRAIAAQFA
jgi:CubicO group peptidase (beta-lactamase class C family)